jgi:hypothetical protein
LRWVGIDEAGYGPNLGPLVMTAVIAESSGPSRENAVHESASTLDLWQDLAGSVDRAGGDPGRFWVDDSKAILRNGRGRDRLEATCLAVLHAIGSELPGSPGCLLDAVGAGTAGESELERWLGPSGNRPAWPAEALLASLPERLSRGPLEPADRSWRIVAVRSVVLGPERFNRRLAQLESKARVHFTAFRELLQLAWDLADDGKPTAVSCDKHGGRHYYLEPLIEAFPDLWITRGPEGPELSRYTMRATGRNLGLSLTPRADAANGLVALASIVSKTIREVWMDVFNGYWTCRVPDLRPTAGYPVDAARFRRSIEPLAREQGLVPDLWWRRK